MLSRKKPGLARLPSFSEVQSIEVRAAHLKNLEDEVHAWEKQHAKNAETELQKRATTIANDLAAAHSAGEACVTEVSGADGALLQAVADRLNAKLEVPILLAGVINGRIDLVATVPKALTNSLRANEIIQQIAPMVAGKGGGRAENARGAGKDPTKLAAALERAREILTSASASQRERASEKA